MFARGRPTEVGGPSPDDPCPSEPDWEETAMRPILLGALGLACTGAAATAGPAPPARLPRRCRWTTARQPGQVAGGVGLFAPVALAGSEPGRRLSG